WRSGFSSADILPTQTSSEHRNFTVVGREKISYASESAKDTFFIVECIIPTPDVVFIFALLLSKTIISNGPHAANCCFVISSQRTAARRRKTVAFFTPR